MLAGVQVDGMSDGVRALLVRAARELRPEVRRLRALERLTAGDDVRSAAAVVGALTSHFRYGSALGEDGRKVRA